MFRSNSMINSNCVRESSPLTVLSGLPRVKHQIYKHKQPRSLRAVPTIVTTHTFCASRDTRVFLSVMLTNTVIFLRGLKLSVESRSL